VAAGAATIALAGGAASAHADTAPAQPTSVKLSDELTRTYWATPWRLGAVRRSPDPGSPGIARLRWFTEDNYPEVYLVLRRVVDPRFGRWLEIRVPGRPNGRTGWVREGQLGPLRLVRTSFVIDRRRLRARLYRRGRLIWAAPVGVGKPSTPTPAGRFWIREVLRVSDPGGLYGPWAFGTSAYSNLSDWPGGGVVGIHGTNQPSLVPGRPSHGCVRMHNSAIRRLVRLMPVGTPVRIV
jgi:L,D-transpeptidase catalytic domain